MNTDTFREVEFGQHNIRLRFEDSNRTRGWVYTINNYHLSLGQHQPPGEDMGDSLEGAIASAKKRIAEHLAAEIKLKQEQLQELELALQSIDVSE